jgi:hypothetical protein
MLAAWAAAATRAAGGGDRLVHDAADGARTPPALGAAPEAAVDLTGGARRLLGGERGADVVIAQNVARTDDHGRPGGVPSHFSSLCNYRYMSGPWQAKTKRAIYTYSNLMLSNLTLSNLPLSAPGASR